jgi:hypothetical protein
MKEKSAEDNRLKKIAIGTTGAAGIGALGYGVRSAARRVKKSLSAGARQSLIELEAKIDSVLFADEEEETPRPKKKMGTAAKVAIGAGALMAGSAIGSAASVRRAARKKINSPMSRMAKNQANEAAKRMMPAFSENIGHLTEFGSLGQRALDRKARAALKPFSGARLNYHGGEELEKLREVVAQNPEINKMFKKRMAVESSKTPRRLVSASKDPGKESARVWGQARRLTKANDVIRGLSAVPPQVIELNAKLDEAINEFRSMDDDEEGSGFGKKLAGAAAVGAAGYGIGKAGGVRAVADKGLQTATNATLAVSRMGGAKKAATGAADALRSGVMAATHGAGVKGGVAAAKKSLLRKGILR